MESKLNVEEDPELGEILEQIKRQEEEEKANLAAATQELIQVHAPVSLMQKEFISQMKEILTDTNCSICLMPLFDEDYEEGSVHCNASCQCLFHTECLAEYAKAQINMGKLPIRCPETNCQNALQAENDLKVLLNQQEMDRW